MENARPGAKESHASHPPRPVKRTRRPLSDEIRDAILDDFIASGVVPGGGMLPSEAELTDRYEVSRASVRAALQALQGAGLIVSHQGRGSRVVPRPEAIISGLDRLCSFETYAANQAQEVRTVDLEYEEVTLSAETARWLDVDAGTRALVIRRAKTYGGCRVAWMVDYIPEGSVSFESLRQEFQGSVLDVLFQHVEIGVDHSDADLVPVALDDSLADRLQVAPGTPALFMDELISSRAGRIIEGGRAWLLPDFFRFRLRRRPYLIQR